MHFHDPSLQMLLAVINSAGFEANTADCKCYLSLRKFYDSLKPGK